MYDKLWLMVPTFKRVEWLKRFMQSAVLMADSINNIKFCVCINHKDIKTLDYLKSINVPLLIVEEKTIQPNIAQIGRAHV